MTSTENFPLDSPLALEAIRIVSQLRASGFIAYFAGGCVRDALLGRTPKDYDIATNATPESVREVFGKRNTLAFGASFGVIGVLPPPTGDRTASVTPTEVTTFRSDGDYSDGRRPDEVVYGDAKQDALRRDFTINGMFFDPHESKVIDLVGGREDLAARRLRTIGSPDERFREDKLRMLRAIRFATVLNFNLEPQTESAIVNHAKEIVQVSGERIGAEMRRVMVSGRCCSGLDHLKETTLANFMMPTLAEIDFEAAQQLLQSIDDRLFAVSLACLAIAHPHPEQMIKDTTHRWKLSNEESRKANVAIQNAETLTRAHEVDWSKVQPILVDRDAAEIVEVAGGIVRSRNLDGSGIQRVVKAMEWPANQLDPPMLITGDDLKAAGIPAGPHYREWLQAVRDGQLNGVMNTADQAWKEIRRLQDESK